MMPVECHGEDSDKFMRGKSPRMCGSSVVSMFMKKPVTCMPSSSAKNRSYKQGQPITSSSSSSRSCKQGKPITSSSSRSSSTSRKTSPHVHSRQRRQQQLPPPRSLPSTMSEGSSIRSPRMVKETTTITAKDDNKTRSCMRVHGSSTLTGISPTISSNHQEGYMHLAKIDFKLREGIPTENDDSLEWRCKDLDQIFHQHVSSQSIIQFDPHHICDLKSKHFQASSERKLRHETDGSETESSDIESDTFSPTSYMTRLVLPVPALAEEPSEYKPSIASAYLSNDAVDVYDKNQDEAREATTTEDDDYPLRYLRDHPPKDPLEQPSKTSVSYKQCTALSFECSNLADVDSSSGQNRELKSCLRRSRVVHAQEREKNQIQDAQPSSGDRNNDDVAADDVIARLQSERETYQSEGAALREEIERFRKELEDVRRILPQTIRHWSNDAWDQIDANVDGENSFLKSLPSQLMQTPQSKNVIHRKDDWQFKVDWEIGNADLHNSEEIKAIHWSGEDSASNLTKEQELDSFPGANQRVKSFNEPQNCKHLPVNLPPARFKKWKNFAAQSINRYEEVANIEIPVLQSSGKDAAVDVTKEWESNQSVTLIDQQQYCKDSAGKLSPAKQMIIQKLDSDNVALSLDQQQEETLKETEAPQADGKYPLFDKVKEWELNSFSRANGRVRKLDGPQYYKDFAINFPSVDGRRLQKLDGNYAVMSFDEYEVETSEQTETREVNEQGFSPKQNSFDFERNRACPGEPEHFEEEIDTIPTEEDHCENKVAANLDPALHHTGHRESASIHPVSQSSVNLGILQGRIERGAGNREETSQLSRPYNRKGNELKDPIADITEPNERHHQGHEYLHALIKTHEGMAHDHDFITKDVESPHSIEENCLHEIRGESDSHRESYLHKTHREEGMPSSKNKGPLWEGATAREMLHSPRTSCFSEEIPSVFAFWRERLKLSSGEITTDKKHAENSLKPACEPQQKNLQLHKQIEGYQAGQDDDYNRGERLVHGDTSVSSSPTCHQNWMAGNDDEMAQEKSTEEYHRDMQLVKQLLRKYRDIPDSVSSKWSNHALSRGIQAKRSPFGEVPIDEGEMGHVAVVEIENIDAVIEYKTSSFKDSRDPDSKCHREAELDEDREPASGSKKSTARQKRCNLTLGFSLRSDSQSIFVEDRFPNSENSARYNKLATPDVGGSKGGTVHECSHTTRGWEQDSNLPLAPALPFQISPCVPERKVGKLASETLHFWETMK